VSREPSPESLEQAKTLFKKWGIVHGKAAKSLANYLDGYRAGCEDRIRLEMKKALRDIVDTYDVGDRLGADPVIAELKRLLDL
jgi:hypothetical protein